MVILVEKDSSKKKMNEAAFEVKFWVEVGDIVDRYPFDTGTISYGIISLSNNKLLYVQGLGPQREVDVKTLFTRFRKIGLSNLNTDWDGDFGEFAIDVHKPSGGNSQLARWEITHKRNTPITYKGRTFSTPEKAVAAVAPEWEKGLLDIFRKFAS